MRRHMAVRKMGVVITVKVVITAMEAAKVAPVAIGHQGAVVDVPSRSIRQ